MNGNLAFCLLSKRIFAPISKSFSPTLTASYPMSLYDWMSRLTRRRASVRLVSVWGGFRKRRFPVSRRRIFFPSFLIGEKRVVFLQTPPQIFLSLKKTPPFFLLIHNLPS